MTYEEANAALHALRDAGYEVRLVKTKFGYLSLGYAVRLRSRVTHNLTQSEIDKMIMEAEE